MKVYKDNGSKEKLFEMMQKVNKIKINEDSILRSEPMIKSGFNFQNLSAGKKVKDNKTGKLLTISNVGADHTFGKDEMGKEYKINNIKDISPVSETYNQWGLKLKKSRLAESFDNPKVKDEKYLDKTVGQENSQVSKYDDGVRYPVEKELKVKDPSVEGLKGDDLPFKNEDKAKEKEIKDIANEIEIDLNNKTGEKPEMTKTNDEKPEVDKETDTAFMHPDSPIMKVAKGEESMPEMSSEVPEVGNDLEGGVGDNDTSMEYDPDQISKGIKVEMEHTNDPKVALDITIDHLNEDPEYYGIGDEDPEEKAKEGAQKDAAEPEGGEEKELEKEILWGKDKENAGDEENLDFDFKPKNVGEDFDFAGAGREYYDKKNIGGDDGQKKYEEMSKLDFNTLPDDQKEEFFQLWHQYGRKNEPATDSIKAATEPNQAEINPNNTNPNFNFPNKTSQ